MQILQATNEESKTNEFYFISDNLDLEYVSSKPIKSILEKNILI